MSLVKQNAFQSQQESLLLPFDRFVQFKTVLCQGV